MRSKSDKKNKLTFMQTLLWHTGLLALDFLFAAALIIAIIGILFFSGEKSEFIYMRF